MNVDHVSWRGSCPEQHRGCHMGDMGLFALELQPSVTTALLLTPAQQEILPFPSVDVPREAQTCDLRWRPSLSVEGDRQWAFGQEGPPEKTTLVRDPCAAAGQAPDWVVWLCVLIQRPFLLLRAPDMSSHCGWSSSRGTRQPAKSFHPHDTSKSLLCCGLPSW